MIDLERFLEEQSAFYDKLTRTNSSIGKEGLVPSSKLFESNRGGYNISLRYPDHITDQIAAFSERIASTVPALRYDKNNIHTTLLVYGIGPDFAQDQKTIDVLCAGVKKSLPYCSRPEMLLQEYLCKSDSIIIKAVAGAEFVDLANSVLSSLNDSDINSVLSSLDDYDPRKEKLRLPSSGHITVSRFTERVPPERLDDFLTLIGGGSPIRSLPAGIFGCRRPVN